MQNKAGNPSGRLRKRSPVPGRQCLQLSEYERLDERPGRPHNAKRLSHGEIGKGLNDYDAIFSELKRVGFDSWISIEDGVEGMAQLERSVNFVRRKIAEHF